MAVSSNRNDLAEYAGIRFWVRGDGSDARGSVGLGIDTGAQISFPLASEEWREYRYPWSRLPFDFKTNETVRALLFGIQTPEPDPRYVLLDEIGLMPDGEDPAGPFPAPAEQKNYLTVRPDDPGHILYNLQTQTNGTQGVRFKYRGGGTTRRMRVHWEGAADRAVWLDLTVPRWQERRILWRDMPPPPDRAAQHIVFRFDPPPLPGHWFVIDRPRAGPRLERRRAPPPPPPADPPGSLDPARFVENAGRVRPVIDRLRSHARTSIVIVGDLTLDAARPDTTPAAPANPDLRPDTYGARMFPGLRAFHKPETAQLRHDVYQPLRRSWDSLGTSSPWSTGLILTAAVLPDADPRSLDAGVEHALTYSPDLVILQTGMLNILYTGVDAYQAGLEQAVKDLQARGVLVVVGLPPPVADLSPGANSAASPWERSRAYAEAARNVARAASCAVVDVPAAFLARGPVAAGPLYQDRTHLSNEGHRLIANLYLHLLGVTDRRIWDGLPAAAETTPADPTAPPE
ncbi:MAG: SGNH/GDSL hydrolase family protein [Kiritimatiellia bacterium]